VIGPLAHPTALPRGTVPGLSAPIPGGSLARLFPVVTPAPAIPGSGRVAPPGPSDKGGGYATALTAESGVINSRQSSLVVLAVSVALGLAVFGAWFTAAGPGRKAVASLARRRGRHTR
jgi:hypothetical protein